MAAIAHEPEFLNEMLGIEFVDHRDDLCDIKVALIQTQSRKQFGLMRHVLCPPETELFVNYFSKKIAIDLIEFINLFQLNCENFSGFHPDIDLGMLPFRSHYTLPFLIVVTTELD